MTLTYGQELKVIVSGYYTGGYILNMVQIRVEFVISMWSARMHDGVTAGLNLYHHLGLCGFVRMSVDGHALLWKIRVKKKAVYPIEGGRRYICPCPEMRVYPRKRP